MSNKSIRIRTTPGGDDKYLKVKIDQDFDSLDVLSLRISQADTYKRVCSDYGVVVGRVIANGGIGVPNAKVSLFIPLSDEDAQDDLISTIYPFTKITEDTGIDGKRYNLLPDYNSKNDECFTPVGSFPSKRKLLDNDVLLEVYEKYYKFTTTTNDAGDYMLFGVPVGTHTLHMDVDMSDIGILSQKPYDLIREGASPKVFESTTKFKGGNDLDTLAQVKSFNTGINIIPFWGDTSECEIGINRHDFTIPTTIKTHAFFMGSLFSDNEKNSISQYCRIKKKLGNLCDTVAGEGTIEMIRKTKNGTNEFFPVEGGRVIDEDGVWAYQIPMNLDYKVTDEFGNLVPSEVPNVGIPTRADVRFRISMDMTGAEGRYRRRASYIVPNNPQGGLADYSFDENSPNSGFRSMYWDNIYTVRNFIGRFQAVRSGTIRSFVGIKDVDDCGSHTPFPYNRYDTDFDPLFSFLCVLQTILVNIVTLINIAIIGPLNGVIKVINVIIGAVDFLLPGNQNDLPYISCITMDCGDNNYAPGCSQGSEGHKKTGLANNNKQDVTNCLQTQLAEALDVYEFDFYNDWVNGSLYFPQFKYKKKKNGNEKFCDADSDKNRTNYIVDTCLNTNVSQNNLVDSEALNIGNDGIIKKIDDKFYYAANASDNTRLNILATDITNLGPISDCSVVLPNNYFMIGSVPDTTYNRPPNGDETDENGVLLTKGLDEFLMNISCIGVRTRQLYCANTKLICELGMGLSEADDDTTPITPADNTLNINDIINEDVRARFISNNNGTVYNINGSDGFVGGVGYENLRDFENKGSGITLANNNSLYFYFGIIPGRSAIQKFNTRYRAECVEVVESSFIINVLSQTNNTVIGGNSGALDIDVIGGSGNYQYNWYDANNSLIAITEDISGLVAGNYRVEVTDLDTGKVGNRDFEITEPIALNLSYYEVPVSTYGGSDGELIIDIIGGYGPYTLEIVSGPNTGALISGISGNNPGGTFSGLVEGTYSVKVTDANGDTFTLTGMSVSEPPQLSMTVIANDTKCGVNNGDITITVVGGTAPYSVTTVGVNNGTSFNTLFESALPDDTYDITVTDANNSVITQTVVINPSNNIVIDSVTTSGGDTITVIASGGVGTLEYDLYLNGVIINNNQTGTFNGLASGNYKVDVRDAIGCLKTTDQINL